jgi:arylsulfatase A-like enzyme
MDGLRRDFLSEATTPNLMAFMRQAERFENYSTVFPSCTRVVSASLATGCFPARHGLQGNSVALMEDGKLVLHDAGHPDFLQHKRRVTGNSLAVPTMAERLKDEGGAIIFSNVSPGAAYAHDPDGHGHVYHRVGSFGPGRVPVSAEDRLDVTLDAAGDRRMTERFIDEVLMQRTPALAVLWMGEPDHIQHEAPLGSPAFFDVLKAADAHAGLVIAAVETLRAQGDDVLLIIGSDHGHETVTGIIDIDAELVAAGLKNDVASRDVVSVSNGTSSLIYLHPDNAGRISSLREFFAMQSWVGQLYGPDQLERIGQKAEGGLTFAISMAASDAPNEYGVAGSSLAAKPAMGKPDRLGCGQHGGMARYEQSPVLLISGTGFRPEAARGGDVRVVDIAPTVLSHLHAEAAGMDGVPLQIGS